jgi:hypothetical protein
MLKLMLLLGFEVTSLDRHLEVKILFHRSFPVGNYLGK